MELILTKGMMRKVLLIMVALVISAMVATAQTDWIHTGTNLGVEKIRLASVPFKANTRT
jgi:hypothetical protein